MKGYLTVVLAFLALCTALFVTGCTDDSPWGASYGGAPIQSDSGSIGTGYTGEAPTGSGSVPYVHEGPF